MNIYSFAVLFFLPVVLASSEFLDFVTVYRITHNESSLMVLAMKEHHRLTNSLGKLLATKNYKFIDSVKGMNSFGCTPLDSTCKCNRSNDWSFLTHNVSAEEYFTIEVDDMESPGNLTPSCSRNNGGCEAFCHISRGLPQCSCLNGFRLIGSACFGDDVHYFVHTNLSGSIQKGPSEHLIIAPANTTIQLKFNVPQCYRCVVKVYEYDHLGAQKGLLFSQLSSQQVLFPNKFFPNEQTQTVSSTTNILHIQYYRERRYDNNLHHLYFQYAVKRPLLTLTSTSGQLDLPVLPKSRNLCISIIYKPVTSNVNATLDLQAKQNEQLYRPSHTHWINIMSWNITRFKLPLESRDPAVLSLSVLGMDTVIHSISGCTPNANLDITTVGVVSPFMLPPLKSYTVFRGKEDINNCYNGGLYDADLQHCNCLPGFMGDECEQGCGPNHYGNECSEKCSNFDQGCLGMIFCKWKMPCLCAPGFSGKYCDSNCIPGFYGASCKFVCGNCKEGQCNIYTGKCDGGCLPGFYPPLCLDTYKYIDHSPNVTHSNFNFVTLTANTSSVTGRGHPKFYQVQYKEISSPYWVEFPPERLLSEVVTANVTQLSPGFKYEARIILHDEDGNTYQNEFVPKVQFYSLCRVSELKNYNLNIDDITASSFAVSWKYDIYDTDCPIKGYDILLRKCWEEKHYNVSSEIEHMTFNGLIPGETYEIEIQAITDFGKAPFSDILHVETNGSAPEDVLNLQVTSADSSKLLASWVHPIFTGGTIKEYVLEYKCVKFLACTESCASSVKQLNTTGTSVTLDGLYPHTQYLIKVAGKVNYLGPYTFAYGATDDSVPQVMPSASDTPIISSTNSTLKVRWLPPESCANLNGYMVGYHYELLSPDNKTLLVGNTSHTNMTFQDLTPQTNYVIRVYVVSSGGWNPDHKLDIDAATAATVPEAVQNLTVYKRGRRMLGIRWAPPHETYGEIKSFSVTNQGGKNKEVTEVISPQRCIPWPEFFCHTITNLIPNKNYIVTVRARNVHIEADGHPAFVTTHTSEGAPGCPVSLKGTDRNSSSVTIEWEPPFIFNGILRSFLINVEQVDSANSSECCEYYPVQEVVVQEERKHYSYEASDLKPASKYIISVSPKTLTIGATSNVTVNTLPDYPLLEPPVVVGPGKVKVPAPPQYTGVESSYLLLVLSDSEHPTAHMWDEEVENLLSAAVNGSFYVVKEFQYEELVEQPEVSVGEGGEPQEGAMGMLQDPVLAPGEYRVGLAAVLDYGGAKTVGFVSSDPFSIEADY